MSVTVAALTFTAWFLIARPGVLGGPVSNIAVSGHSMEPTYQPGDFLVVRAESGYSVGDIVVFDIPEGDPGAGSRVVHRIVGGDGATGWTTKGDNNATGDPWQPTDDRIVGRVWLRIPALANWLSHLRDPLVLAIVIGLMSFLIVLAPATSLRALWQWFKE